MNQSVDPELIRRYLAGELDDKAMHALEKQALDDPFLADALEGYAERKPDQRIHLADLNRRLEKRVQGKEEMGGMVFRLNYRWMAAAGVLLLVGAGLLWIWQGEPGEQKSIAYKSMNVSDSSITDTLQYYNQEEPVAWKKATPEKPLAISIPADTGFLASKDNRINAALAAETPLASVMMRRDDSALLAVAPAAPMADSTEGRIAGVANAKTQEATAEEMAGRNAAAYSPTVTTRLIQGRVKTSDNEEGMPGATVSIEGTGKGVLTDNEGKFSIRVADTVKDVKLVVAAIGFNSRKMEVSQKENNLDITLREQVTALSEAVVANSHKSKKAGGYRMQQENLYQPPAPKEGYDRYEEYLIKNVRYPASAAARNVSGKVKVSFRVMPDGTLADFKITRRLQPDCDAEALRVVKEGPEWTPASDRKATRVQVEVPFAPK
jgi:TonB family protein